MPVFDSYTRVYIRECDADGGTEIVERILSITEVENSLELMALQFEVGDIAVVANNSDDYFDTLFVDDIELRYYAPNGTALFWGFVDKDTILFNRVNKTVRFQCLNALKALAEADMPDITSYGVWSELYPALGRGVDEPGNDYLYPLDDIIEQLFGILGISVGDVTITLDTDIPSNEADPGVSGWHLDMSFDPPAIRGNPIISTEAYRLTANATFDLTVGATTQSVTIDKDWTTRHTTFEDLRRSIRHGINEAGMGDSVYVVAGGASGYEYITIKVHDNFEAQKIRINNANSTCQEELGLGGPTGDTGFIYPFTPKGPLSLLKSLALAWGAYFYVSPDRKGYFLQRDQYSNVTATPLDNYLLTNKYENRLRWGERKDGVVTSATITYLEDFQTDDFGGTISAGKRVSANNVPPSATEYYLTPRVIRHKRGNLTADADVLFVEVDCLNHLWRNDGASQKTEYTAYLLEAITDFYYTIYTNNREFLRVAVDDEFFGLGLNPLKKVSIGGTNYQVLRSRHFDIDKRTELELLDVS